MKTITAPPRVRRAAGCLVPWLAMLFAALPGSAGAQAGAAAMPQLWLNPGIYSYHFDRGANYRDNNLGFGAELLLTQDHALLAGSFINSDRARTHYAGYQWRPLHWRPRGVTVSAGVAVSAFDGYPRYHDGGWFVAPLPTLGVEGRYLGLNIALVPTISDRVHGALSFQVKLRVW